MKSSSTEYPSYDQSMVDRILAEEQFIVFPNKYDQAPTLAENVIATIFEENTGEVLKMLETLTNYLQGICVGDQFGADHDNRRRKLQEYHQKYGTLFVDAIENRNKFRVNRAAIVLPNIRRMAKFSERSGHFSLAKSLFDLVDSTIQKIEKYPSYSEIDSLDTKYEIVCIFDDAIVSVYETIASYYHTLIADN